MSLSQNRSLDEAGSKPGAAGSPKYKKMRLIQRLKISLAGIGARPTVQEITINSREFVPQ